MHELALSRAILDIGLRSCGGRRVTSVTVDVGALRQVVATSLVQCWGFVTADTSLEGSQLVVNEIEAVIECESCGARTRMVQPYMVCGSCGGQQVDVITGREFLLRSIDVVGDEQPAPFEVTTRSFDG